MQGLFDAGCARGGDESPQKKRHDSSRSKKYAFVAADVGIASFFFFFFLRRCRAQFFFLRRSEDLRAYLGAWPSNVDDRHQATASRVAEGERGASVCCSWWCKPMRQTSIARACGLDRVPPAGAEGEVAGSHRWEGGRSGPLFCYPSSRMSIQADAADRKSWRKNLVRMRSASPVSAKCTRLASAIFFFVPHPSSCCMRTFFSKKFIRDARVSPTLIRSLPLSVSTRIADRRERGADVSILRRRGIHPCFLLQLSLPFREVERVLPSRLFASRFLCPAFSLSTSARACKTRINKPKPMPEQKKKKTKRMQVFIGSGTGEEGMDQSPARNWRNLSVSRTLSFVWYTSSRRRGLYCECAMKALSDIIASTQIKNLHIACLV
jgi:hypothetical protein